jgi:hypothetical protein
MQSRFALKSIMRPTQRFAIDCIGLAPEETSDFHSGRQLLDPPSWGWDRKNKPAK